jgi:hypothetical protein
LLLIASLHPTNPAIAAVASIAFTFITSLPTKSSQGAFRGHMLSRCEGSSAMSRPKLCVFHRHFSRFQTCSRHGMIRNQRTSALIIAALLVSASASAQTRVELQRNSFTPAQDVQLGQRAAADARRQLPMLNDGPTDAVVERIGRRLVSAVPARFRIQVSGTHSMS